MPANDHWTPGLLRLTTAGSVDDGKSTLIGRLLYDAGAVTEDQVAALRRNAERQGRDEIDLSLLTDGLSIEREQGITIDVAYRYFTAGGRRFVLADAPGHVQYTRNMATAASAADAAVVLVDAGKGLLDQTRRHFCIAHLVGIRQIAVAVNKMDKVGFDEGCFRSIETAIRDYARQLGFPMHGLHVLPVTATDGDNVVRRGARLEWWSGPTLLDLLLSLPGRMESDASAPLRLPVQYVARGDDGAQAGRRIYLGRIESGRLALGQRIAVLPSGLTARIDGLFVADRETTMAAAPCAVAFTLADEIDLGRGDLVVGTDRPARLESRFEATICWLDDRPHDLRGRYLLKCGTRTLRARLESGWRRLDLAGPTLEDARGTPLERNDIARATIGLQSPLAFDSFDENRATGAFILIDEQSNHTVAAGMIAAA